MTNNQDSLKVATTTPVDTSAPPALTATNSVPTALAFPQLSEETSLTHLRRAFDKPYDGEKFDGTNAKSFIHQLKLDLKSRGVFHLVMDAVNMSDLNVIAFLDQAHSFIIKSMEFTTGLLWAPTTARNIINQLETLAIGLPAQKVADLMIQHITFTYEGEATLADLSANSHRHVDCIEQLKSFGVTITEAQKVIVFSNALSVRLPHMSQIESDLIANTPINEPGNPIFNWAEYHKKCSAVIGSLRQTDSAPLRQTIGAGFAATQQTGYAATQPLVPMSLSQALQIRAPDQRTRLHKFCGHLDSNTGIPYHGWNVTTRSGVISVGHTTNECRRASGEPRTPTRGGGHFRGGGRGTFGQRGRGANRGRTPNQGDRGSPYNRATPSAFVSSQVQTDEILRLRNSASLHATESGRQAAIIAQQGRVIQTMSPTIAHMSSHIPQGTTVPQTSSHIPPGSEMAFQSTWVPQYPSTITPNMNSMTIMPESDPNLMDVDNTSFSLLFGGNPILPHPTTITSDLQEASSVIPLSQFNPQASLAYAMSANGRPNKFEVLIDTGANTAFAGKREHFSKDSIKSISGASVTGIDASNTFSPTEMGDIEIKSPFGSMTIKNVQLLPSLGNRVLLDTNRFTARGYYALFMDKRGIIYDPVTETVILSASHTTDKLYSVDVCPNAPLTFVQDAHRPNLQVITKAKMIVDRLNKPLSNPSSKPQKRVTFQIPNSSPPVITPPVNTTTRTDTLENWHKILGHTNGEYIRKFIEANPNCGAKLSNKKQFNCEPCIAAKHSRKPIPKVNHRPSFLPGSCIHLDIHFNMQIPSFSDKFIGYVLYVDECSKYRVMHGITKKNDLAPNLPRILAFFQRQTGNPLKLISLDKAGENQAVITHCKTNGIQYHLSAAGEQYQNATAERHGGVIDSLTRSNLFQSKLPDPFWFHAALYSTITLNLLPSKGSSDFGKSCFELFTGKAPNLSNLRSFGQVCWVPQRRTVTTVNLSKSELVNVKTIFLGYNPNYSAGRFLEPITMKQFNIPLHRVVKLPNSIQDWIIVDKTSASTCVSMTKRSQRIVSSLRLYLYHHTYLALI